MSTDDSRITLELIDGRVFATVEEPPPEPLVLIYQELRVVEGYFPSAPSGSHEAFMLSAGVTIQLDPSMVVVDEEVLVRPRPPRPPAWDLRRHQQSKPRSMARVQPFHRQCGRRKHG